jgi:hypothetical protein
VFPLYEIDAPGIPVSSIEDTGAVLEHAFEKGATTPFPMLL